MRRATFPLFAAAIIAATAPAFAAGKPHHKAAVHALAKVKPVHQLKVAHKFAPPAISVPLDEVRVVAFSHPVATVYVGNPMIADVSMIDSRHAFVLGKGFGGTNIVALDTNGKQVVNEHISVFGHVASTVIVHRGTAQATYNCASARCEAAPTPGDDKETYDSRMSQMLSRQEAGVKAAGEGR